MARNRVVSHKVISDMVAVVGYKRRYLISREAKDVGRLTYSRFKKIGKNRQAARRASPPPSKQYTPL